MAYHLRRHDKAIEDPALIEQILSSTAWVTLAMCQDGDPYLVTVSHGFDPARRCLYFHCAAEGRKVDILSVHPRVWGQAVIDRGYVPGECTHRYASVMFSGVVEWIEDEDEKRHALGCMIRQLDPDPDAVAASLLGPEEASTFARTRVGRIRIESWTGKRSRGVQIP